MIWRWKKRRPAPPPPSPPHVQPADIDPARHVQDGVIRSYGPGRFNIAGEAYFGPILVFPHRVTPWAIQAPEQAFSEKSFTDILAAGETPEIVLIGCGDTMRPPPPQLVEFFQRRGVALDCMATAAACRSFNILLSEQRAAVAALLPCGPETILQTG